MRNTEGNSPRQRSRRSWRIVNPMEQAGTMGKRRAVPGHDRPTLDPIFGSASKLHWRKVGGIDAQGRLKVHRADGKIFLFECHHRKDHRSLTNQRSEPLRLFLLANPKFQMNGTFGNVYEHGEWARAYATLEFPGTYYLGFRDLPALIRRYDHGSRALDFGWGTGRSTRLLRNLGLNV